MYQCDPSTLTSLIECGTRFFQLAVPVLVALALLYFFWGIASFILKADDQEEMKKGKSRMVWGIVTLFLILSVAGFLAAAQNTFFGTSTRFSDPSTSIHIPPGSIVDRTQSGTLYLDPDSVEPGSVRFGSRRESDQRRFPYFCLFGRVGDCPLR